MENNIKIIVLFLTLLLIGYGIFLIINKDKCNPEIRDCLDESMIIDDYGDKATYKTYKDDGGVFSFKYPEKIQGYKVSEDSEEYYGGNIITKLILENGNEKLSSNITIDVEEKYSESKNTLCEIGDVGVTVESDRKCIYTYDFEKDKFYLPDNTEIKKEDFSKYNIITIGEKNNIPAITNSFSAYEEQGKIYTIVDSKNDMVVVLVWNQFVIPYEKKDAELEITSILLEKILSTFKFN